MALVFSTGSLPKSARNRICEQCLTSARNDDAAPTTIEPLNCYHSSAPEGAFEAVTYAIDQLLTITEP